MNGLSQLCICAYFVTYVLRITAGQVEFAQFKHINPDGFIDSDTSIIIKTKSGPTTTGCAYLCHAMRACAAFYYTPSLRECRMLNNSRSRTAVMHSQIGTRYYERENDGPADTETTPKIPNTGWKMGDSGDMFTTTNRGPNFGCMTIHTKWTELRYEYQPGLTKKYKFFTDKKLNQVEARTLCENEKSRLPTFLTKQKLLEFQRKVLEVCTDLDFNLFWVDGENSMDPSGSYVTWNNLTIPEDSDMWFNGKPEHRDERHCLRISNLAHEFKLVTSLCSEANARTFCEK